MTDELRRLKRAAARRDRAEREYRSALAACDDAGETFAAIGRAVGITKQAARAAVLTARRRRPQ